MTKYHYLWLTTDAETNRKKYDTEETCPLSKRQGEKRVDVLCDYELFWATLYDMIVLSQCNVKYHLLGEN